MILVWSGAVVVCIVLWRIMFGIASTFVGLSEGTAKYGFLALASAIVAFAVSISFYIMLKMRSNEFFCQEGIYHIVVIYHLFSFF